MRQAKPERAFLICVLLCFVVAVAALLYPVYVIRPFRAQGPRELLAALAVLRYRAVVMILCGLSSLAALAWYWNREARRFRRAGAAACVIAVAVVAALSRVNIYERMFHPFERPSFARADEAKLDGDEKVIAISVGGEARAYPIRVISYHHVINDVVGGVPIVATY
jgi:hypothetical protein